jgi:hypothetical protein
MRLFKFFCLLLILSVNGCASNGSKETSSVPAKSTDAQTAVTPSGTGTLVINEIVFSDDAGVPAAVEQECNLLQGLSGNIKTAAASQYASILEGSVSAPADADVLKVEIINLVGPGGGAWSGGKSVLIKGSLTKKGQHVGSFKALRVSSGGVWGGYMGTCAILGRCIKTLGEDVAGWLKHPVDNAKLGDL